ncbi:MAG: serine/threonine protein phosphatase, partial [Oscillospiraceae bacterium]|nr:serine/threonine protein phosphatase [Oscillospiraceae bacterium]
MALYAISDLHLSFGTDQPMDVFPGWDNYTERLEKNWEAVVKPEDTVVIAGDI